MAFWTIYLAGHTVSFSELVMHQFSVILSLICVVAFYLYLFWSLPKNKTALVCVIIAFATIAIVSIVKTAFLYGSIILAGYLVSIFVVGMVSGATEEFFRSVFSCFYATKTPKERLLETLTELIKTLALIYAAVESGLILREFVEFRVGNASPINLELSSPVLSALNPAFYVVLVSAIILRYYVHLFYLELSIISRLIKNHTFFWTCILLHAFGNLLFTFAVARDAEFYIIVLLLVEMLLIGLSRGLLRRLPNRIKLDP